MNLPDNDMPDAAMPLRIRLLGPPRTEWGDDLLSIPRRQVRALLYHLAADGQPASRERLCFLFWPDAPDSTARRNLTNLLCHLRNAMPAAGLVLTEGDQVRLDSERIWTDTVAFDRLCADNRTLEQAVAQYHGPFLDGFSLPDSPEFEMWAALERRAWERRYLDALETLIDEHSAHGQHECAIDFARAYLEADELAEDIHRRLIELHAATGDRASALHQYEQCAAILERELGVRPLPETRAIYKAIRSERRPARIELTAAPRWTTLPSIEANLVGRHTAMQQLAEASDQARAGRGGTVLICGEPGIGKSRLMEEFASGVHGKALVLVGNAYRDLQTTAYGPIVEALRVALRAGPSWLAAPPCCLAEARQLLPELGLLYPDLPPPVEDKGTQRRSRLFEALLNLALALTAGLHPVLLCLDDLHWADNSSLDWLAYLSRRIENARMLVVGTYRVEEADAITELHSTLSRLANFRELELARLDESAVLELIRGLHQGRAVEGDRTAAKHLSAATGGNPFFLLELLRSLLESGRPMEAFSNLESLPLPDTIVDVVETRLRRLSSKARQVLEAAAVLGQVFSFEAAHRTAGRREMETIDALDELVARQLFRQEGARYRFCHELIQVAVYRSLGYWRRRVLHRRAGEALEELNSANAAALARHFSEAEEPGRAAAYALRAGRAAKRVFAHVEARSHFDRALALLQEEAAQLEAPDALASNRRLQIEALHERGWALRLVGDMEAYADDLETVGQLAGSLGEQRTLAHLHWRQAYTHRWFCRYLQARQTAEIGLGFCQQEVDCLVVAHCWREIGVASREMGDYATAKAALERALALYCDAGEMLLQIHALGNLATLYWYQNEYSRSVDLAHQALKLCDEAELPLARRLPLGDLGASAAAQGDLEMARHCLEESLSIASEIADRTQEILCLLHLGWLSIRQMEPAEALSHLGAGLELAERIGSCTERGLLLCGLAEAHRLSGRPGAAKAHAQQALSIAQAKSRLYDETLARRILEDLAHD